MWTFLKKIFIGCDHKWKTLNAGPLYYDPNDTMPVGRWYDQECTKCGTIQRINLKAK